MRNKIFLLSLLFWIFFSQWVNAWVVPWTIQTSSVTANVSCNSSSNYYSPTYGYCDTSTKTAKVSWWDYLYDYSDSSGKSWYYGPGAWYTAIDTWETCSWESSGTSHTPHRSKTINCTFWSGVGTTYDSNTYEWWGSDGECTPKKWTNNLITSYNQIGWVSRTTSSTWWACKVEWRYATTDNLAPVSTVNNVSKIFLNKDTVWCNIEKYRSSWYDKKLHPWCAEYAKQNTNISGNDDLLKWLDIQIDNDISWIWKVEVQLWMCSTSYVSPITDAGILQSTSSANGVKSEYTKWFTLKYNQTTTAFWITQPSLLSKFGKNRLDECLWNGKNNLIITTYDMARWPDWITLAWNSKKNIISWVFVDNNTSILEKTGDLVKDNTSDPDMWRNFSLEWNIKVGENVNDKSLWECKLTTGTGSCWTPKSWFVWTAPLWVNPTTWIFTQYICDGLTFPLTSECVQQPIPATPKVCTWTIPSNAIKSNTWWLIVDTPWQNVDNTANCYYEVPVVYCTAWWVVPCIVKPSWPIIVTPVIDWVCWWSHGVSVASAPTSWLCNSWTASAVTWTWPWTWTCNWSWSGSTASCNANKSVVSACNYEPTITWWGWKFYWSWPKCYNNPANSWGWVNVKYTCDSAWNLFYDWSPSVIGAYRYMWADKENCFVDCVKPSTCSTAISWSAPVFIETTIAYSQESDFITTVCPHLNSTNWTTFTNCPYTRETERTWVCSNNWEIQYNYIWIPEVFWWESYEIYKYTCS